MVRNHSMLQLIIGMLHESQLSIPCFVRHLYSTQSVTDMRSMFKSAYAFNGDISTWNTSSVTSMRAMFAYSTSFNNDISRFDTSNVGDFGEMFSDALRYVCNIATDLFLTGYTNTQMNFFMHSKQVLTAISVRGQRRWRLIWAGCFSTHGPLMVICLTLMCRQLIIWIICSRMRTGKKEW